MQMLVSLKAKAVSFFILFFFLVNPIVFGQLQNQLKWEELPPIPDKEGFAGMFAGVSNDALICMGGSNFPDKMPWDGGVKRWYDHIYILEQGASSWKMADEKLPVPLAYGVSITYKNNIILVGGSDNMRHYSDVYKIAYQNGKIKIDTLLSLPFPLANMTGALVGDVLFIAGGNTTPDGIPGNHFLGLNLLENQADQKWVALNSWPGPARIQPVSASLANEFFLFSGINVLSKTGAESERVILKDAYKFIPRFNGKKLAGGQWTKLSDMPRGVAAGASPAPTMGSDHILFPGGLDEITAKHTDPETYPGFLTDLQAYHIGSDRWLKFGNLPEGNTRVTVPVVKWDDKWVIPNGEMGPGRRSPNVFALSKNIYFGWINWTTLIIYLGLMIVIGVIFDKKGQTTKNFFTASGKIPWWAAGLSIFGSQLSAITFMATPAIVYATDWSLVIASLMIVATVPIVIKFYVPFFRRLNITSAYEYLEHRFNQNVRVLGSLSFILFQLGRIGVVLFLPAIAIASVTGIDIYLIILIMGIICILYTVMGGIEAVVWTDVVQVFILMGSAILCLFIATLNVEGGLAGVFSKGMEADKFTMVHLGWASDKPVLWVIIVGFFFLNLIPYTSDQTVVQRYLTVKDERSAGKSLWTNAIFTLPSTFIFFALGTVLYVFYKDNPGNIPSEQVGEILPHFVVQELPVGIAGLVIAGIFAASQSTLSASMNSVAAAYVSDIYPRFTTGSTDKDNLRVAKLVTIAVGIVGIASAMLVAFLNVQFLFNLFMEILGIMGGSLAGVFILGIFTKRANSMGAIWGLVISVVVVWMARSYTDISVYLYGAISVFTTILAGYLISLLTSQKKNLRGLTYLTLDKTETAKTELNTIN